jgi:2,4-dienoyl-CoA reductase (NADPH2)
VLERVWQPGRIGPLELPHRIVMGSMHLGLEGIDDGGEGLVAFYRERVEGGAALIVTGGSAVSRVGAGGRNYSFVNDDADAPKLERVAAAVHEAGGRVLLQLFHAGRYAYQSSFGLQPVAPSAVYSGYSRCEPRALTGDEIHATIDDFARGAARAIELGFDGVELMGSEGYLLNQFMAPVTNRREDEWGGDAERRRRFPLAVTEAVRDACTGSPAPTWCKAAPRTTTSWPWRGPSRWTALTSASAGTRPGSRPSRRWCRSGHGRRGPGHCERSWRYR